MADTTPQGGLPVVQADPTDTPAAQPSVAAKPAVKSKYSLGISAGPIASDQEGILASMQKLLEEKQAQKDSWLERLKDAKAVFTGMGGTQAEAMNMRTNQRNAQNEDIFAIQSQLAQFKAAQDAAAREANSLRNPNGVAGGQGGVGAGDMVPGSENLPAGHQAEINRLLNLGTPEALAEAKKIRADWFKQSGNARATLLNNPAALERKYEIITPDGKQDFVDYFTAINALNSNKAKPTGRVVENGAAAPSYGTLPGVDSNLGTISGVESGNKNVKNPTPGSTASGEFQMTQPTFDLLKKKYPEKLAGITWDTHNADTDAGKAARTLTAQTLQDDNKQLLQNAGIPASPIAERAAWFKGSAPWVRAVTSPEYQNDPIGKYLTKEELAKNNLSGDMKVGDWVADQQRKMQPYQVASTANVAAPTGNVTLPEARLKTEAEKSFTTKQSEKAGEGAGTRKSKMFELAESSDDVIRDANMLENHANTKPHIFAIGKGLTFPSVLTTAGEIAMPWKQNKEVENMVANKVLSPNDIAAREQVGNASDRLGINYANDVFKGARMGIGLEKMAVNAKGVGTDLTAETNKVNSAIIREAAKFQQAKVNMWKEYKAAHGGESASFDAFESTPEYIALRVSTKDNLIKQFPGKFVAVKDEEGTTSAAPSKFDKYRIKKAQ
jgi:hypothetical protein